ncbi:glycosyltransferase [Eisenbergiella sp.]
MTMKHIVYLNNYIGSEIVSVRNNQSACSQAANNKIAGIVISLKKNSCKIDVISSGLLGYNRLAIYRRFVSQLKGERLTYSSAIGIPLISTIWSMLACFHELKRIHKIDNIDNIIFYNFKPEVAFVAYWAKRKYGIPITVEYEDGISDLKPSFKTWIMKKTEELIMPHIDSAITVNSFAEKKFSVPVETIRGVIDSDFYNKCHASKKNKNGIFTILYSGGLNQKRGIYVLLDSLKYIKFPCKIQITGGEGIKTDDSRVELLGYLEYAKVQELMINADVLVQAQLVDSPFASESFPSKLFEYIPTGNSIVSSALPDVVCFAKDALFYYDNDSAEELADVISNIYYQHDNRGKEEKLEELCRENMPPMVGKRLMKILA